MRTQPRGGLGIALRALALATLMALGGCATAGIGGASDSAVEGEIVRELQLSAERWNAGDLEGFLRPYLDDPTITFVGAGGLIRGKDAIRDLYRESYWKDGGPGQTLRFEGIEVRPLGPRNALTTGRFQLFDRAGSRVAEGAFSLVFARTPQGWRIVHDHSS